VEALLTPASRPACAQALVDRLVATVEEASIENSIKASMAGSLEWLRQQSIGQAGRELANSLLSGKTYSNQSAGAFFQSCYEHRSNIVHRGTTRRDVDMMQLSSTMEEFVANLLIFHL
jgi:hypothetical protein